MPLKPQKLNKDSIIAIISPAGPVKDPHNITNAKKYFESKGYRVKIAPHSLNTSKYLAGSDTNRLNDLINAFNDPEVGAIICSRGGYGSFRLLNAGLPKLPPKIFIGYSDITALLNNMGFVTFHGPMAVSDFGKDTVDEYTEDLFWKIITCNAKTPFCFPNPHSYHCINPGRTEGTLAGGNLSIICGLLGTPYSLDFTGKILLVEDVNEPLYKIDRMLAQLRLAGVFEKVSGLLFAEFTSIDVFELVCEYCSGLNIPIGYGFPAGHGEKKATLPFGVNYLFDSGDFKLELSEEYLE